MGKLIHLLGAAALLPLGLAAQTITPASGSPAAPADNGAAAAEKPAEKPGVVPAMDKPLAETVGPVSDLPSRYAGSDVSGYVEALATVLAIRTRTTDPFAQVQDTAAKPIKPKISHAPVARAAAIPLTPYSEIVAQIQVTTVMPGEGKFLVGDRTFKKGDRFPLTFRGRNYSTEITEVTSDHITMRNLENTETGMIKLNMMPSGMSKGGLSSIAPGMKSSSPNAPLEIDSGSPSQLGGSPNQFGGAMPPDSQTR